MATISTSYVVTTTSQTIVGLDNVTQYVTIVSGGDTYIGDSVVTTASGIKMANNDVLQFTLPEGCDLWALTNTGTHVVNVLITRVD